MKTIANFNFPENAEELNEWKPAIYWKALSHNILVVAKTRREGTWKAYIKAVAGVNHDREYLEVINDGTPVIEEYARVFFPQFEELPYAK